MSIPTVTDLADELNQLQLKIFNYDFAWELGSRLRARAQDAKAPVAIEVRHGTDMVFATLLSGATIDNFDWTRRKCAVAHRFHRSSLSMRLEAEAQGYNFNSRFHLPEADYVASGGGVPLMLASGTCVGSVGVSGLPDIEDHQLIVATLRNMLTA